MESGENLSTIFKSNEPQSTRIEAMLTATVQRHVKSILKTQRIASTLVHNLPTKSK